MIQRHLLSVHFSTDHRDSTEKPLSKHTHLSNRGKYRETKRGEMWIGDPELCRDDVATLFRIVGNNTAAVEQLHYHLWSVSDEEIDTMLRKGFAQNFDKARNHSVLLCHTEGDKIFGSFIGSKDEPVQLSDKAQETLNNSPFWKTLEKSFLKVDFTQAENVIYVCFIEDPLQEPANEIIENLDSESTNSHGSVDFSKVGSSDLILPTSLVSTGSLDSPPRPTDPLGPPNFSKTSIRAYVGQAKTFSRRWEPITSSSGTNSHIRDVMRCLEGISELDVRAVKNTSLCDKAIAKVYLSHVVPELRAMEDEKEKREKDAEKKKKRRQVYLEKKASTQGKIVERRERENEEKEKGEEVITEEREFMEAEGKEKGEIVSYSELKEGGAKGNTLTDEYKEEYEGREKEKVTKSELGGEGEAKSNTITDEYKEEYEGREKEKVTKSELGGEVKATQLQMNTRKNMRVEKRRK
eukprot:TRINITY_DN1365_c0_g1_i1.p1 TRINITY_DN1365_c0_g1~~TRINITY_DN1365_c0_g1_i1.p1  ORF type:complete len:465 (+),score=123.28 TRINITY_DN1365_c0_g1_i1:3-1397(+)